jgi:hypothetical protein
VLPSRLILFDLTFSLVPGPKYDLWKRVFTGVIKFRLLRRDYSEFSVGPKFNRYYLCKTRTEGKLRQRQRRGSLAEMEAETEETLPMTREHLDSRMLSKATKDPLPRL